jgi:NDP-sugar pyrophosphorylase family protein
MLREISRHPAMRQRSNTALDIGGDLLPWLVRHQYPVYCHRIQRMGDLGNIGAYLQTMAQVMNGAFPSVTPYLTALPRTRERLYIDPTSWEMIDPISRLTLRQKVACGMVTIQAPVRIGKYVRIDPGVMLEACNIDDECVIHAHASITRASIGEGSIVGPYSQVSDSVLGMMVRMQSTLLQPVVLADIAAIGDEVSIEAGVVIAGRISVNPRLTLPRNIRLTSPMEVTSAADLQTAIARDQSRLPLSFPTKMAHGDAHWDWDSLVNATFHDM